MTTHHDTIIAAWQRLLDAAPHIDDPERLASLGDLLKDVWVDFGSPPNGIEFDHEDACDCEKWDLRRKALLEGLRALCPDLPEPSSAFSPDLVVDHAAFWKDSEDLRAQVRGACTTGAIGRLLCRACYVVYYRTGVKYF